jgi:alpha-tubulin suppressor-like RCC1 family protein
VEGKCFAFGYSEKGRLGNFSQQECEKKNIFTTPVEIKKLDGNQITQLIVGKFHTLAVNTKGKIYGWGENRNYVFGISKNEVEVGKTWKLPEIFYYPEELHINKYIMNVNSEYENLYQTYFLSSVTLQLNSKISKKFKISKISCGGKFSIALTNTGDILSWGYGDDVREINLG